MNAHAPLGGRLLTKPMMVLILLAMAGAAVLATRFLFGLGSVTNLNDGYPWGIWIVIDVVIGTAFGCAGYAMAILVYALNRGEYHPLIRPAMMASLFGYTLGGMAVMFDLGRYWQFYTLFMPWYIQPNSVMLEIALCVMGYIVVLWIEFTPAFLEKLGLHDIKWLLNKVLFVIVALGLLLPTMHQSSLGTVLVVLGHQISPLWQTQLLPLLFLMTAILMGFGLVAFEGMLAALGLRRPLETDILGKVTRIMAGLLAAFLIIRFADLIWRGALGYAFEPNLQAFMFWVENVLFVAALAMMLPHTNQTRARPIFLASFTLLLAACINRINAYLIGYDAAGGGWNYFPSVTEMLVTLGVFSLEVIVYLVFVKRLPVLHRAEHA